MVQNFRDSTKLFNAMLSPSGMFSTNASGWLLNSYMPPIESHMPQSESSICVSGGTLIFNPMPTHVDCSIRDKTSVETQDLFLKEYRDAQKIKIIDRSSVSDYSSTLFRELAPNLVQFDHDLILFPLRGCRQPGILSKVIAGIPQERMLVFNFTYATSTEQQSRIKSELSQKLSEQLPDKATVRIGILDTAKGGYGSDHLAKLLVSLHGGRAQQWAVQFHLLHAKDSKPNLAHRIPKYSTDSVLLMPPIFYEVESLLVEDWSEGIGLSVELDGKTHELKRCSTPGKIILRDDASILLIESESISQLVTKLIVDAVNEQMLDDTQFQFVRDYLDSDFRA